MKITILLYDMVYSGAPLVRHVGYKLTTPILGRHLPRNILTRMGGDFGDFNPGILRISSWPIRHLPTLVTGLDLNKYLLDYEACCANWNSIFS